MFSFLKRGDDRYGGQITVSKARYKRIFVSYQQDIDDEATNLGKNFPEDFLPMSVQSLSEPNSLRDLTSRQLQGGLAAWLGWLFDGMDSTLYVLVAGSLVPMLVPAGTAKTTIVHIGSYIQAALLVGWALGGTLFGRVGDRIGRSRTMALTILLFSLCTGLSTLAPNWQTFLGLRFLAALGIGGEWAAGSSLVCETWPKRWRPWVSATLQSAFQCGILIATLAAGVFAANPRLVFLVGALPALLVYWIRRAVPEPEEWTTAKQQQPDPPVIELFRGPVRRTTILSLLICSASLTTVWALIFWYPQQLRQLPDIAHWSDVQKQHYVALASLITTIMAIGGNYFAAFLAHRYSYKIAISITFIGAWLGMLAAYAFPHNHVTILYYIIWAHFFSQGVFGLYPLYIPPLFPTLLRTTGAGFSYNTGRIVAAIGTVVFGVLAPISNFARALVWVAWLYIPALLIALLIPEPSQEGLPQ